MAAASGMCWRTVRGLSNISRTLVLRSNIPVSTSSRVQMTTATETNTSSNKETLTDTKSEADPPTCSTSDIQITLKEEKTKLESQLKETKDKYLRSLAETENVRQRMRKQVDEAKLFGIQGFCKDLLEVADVLSRATESMPNEVLAKKEPHLLSLFEGLKMTEAQLQQVFYRHGLEQITPHVGEKFDPHLHEAMFEVPTQDDKSGNIAILQKIGYKLHQRTLRPALVGVFKSTS